MTSRGRTLKVDIVGDADSLKREIAAARRAVSEAERELDRINGTTEKVTRSTDELGTSFSRQDKIVGSLRQQWMGYTAAIGTVTAAAAGALYTAGQFVEVARQEEQARARVTEIFEGQADAIAEWADQADQAIGLSRRAAFQAAGDFGNMFDQLGFGQEQTVSMSTAIVNLAADYRDFHDADISDVITAQSAAFRGEYDALQRYLPTINAAHVEQKAMQLGLAETTKELTAQDKALATFRIMMEESGKAVGASAREADELSGQQARLNAEIENLQSNIGETLIPAFTEATTAMNDFLDAHGEDIARGVAAGIDEIAAALSSVETAIGLLKDSGPVQIVFEFLKKDVPTVPTVNGEKGPSWLDTLGEAVQTGNPFRDIKDIADLVTWILGEPGEPDWQAGELDAMNAGRPYEPGGAPPTVFRASKTGMVSTPPPAGSSVFDLIRQQYLDAQKLNGAGSSIRNGGKTDAEIEQEAQLRELDRLTEDFFREQRRAYADGGDEAVAEVRRTQQEYVEEVTSRAEELSEALGISLSAALAEARAEAEELADKERERAEAMKATREELLADVERLTGASLTTENQVGLRYRDVLTGFAGGDLSLFEPLVQLAGAGGGASFSGGGSVAGADVIRAIQSGQFTAQELADAVASAIANNQNFGQTLTVTLSDDLQVVP